MKKILIKMSKSKFIVLSIILSLFFVKMSQNLSASELRGTYWKFGNIDFTYPLANVDASFYWKSITTGDEMFGAQTTLLSYPTQPVILIDDVKLSPDTFRLAFGGITSLKSNGMPYMAISAKLCKLVDMNGNEILFVGIGGGYDFKEHQKHLIMGATKKLW